MGYNAWIGKSMFLILPDQIPGAHAALVKFFSDPENEDLFYLPKEQPIQDATVLEILESAGFHGKLDALGGIANLGYSPAAYYGESFGIMNAIASFVHSGSYLDWIDEEGERWRWLFENGTVREQSAKITYEDT